MTGKKSHTAIMSGAVYQDYDFLNGRSWPKAAIDIRMV
jgi:hypothetical protein